LQPPNPGRALLPSPPLRARARAGHWENPFDHCRFACRTHARSTSHENAYIDARHHCFSAAGRPLTSQQPAAEALRGTTVVLGAAGKSCTEACQSSGKKCVPSALPLLDACDRLREHAGCEAGCAADPRAPWQPGYMESKAPKAQRPALCVVSEGGGAGAGAGSSGAATGDCDAKSGHVQRLCACGS
jgi:hypothetical protein